MRKIFIYILILLCLLILVSSIISGLKLNETYSKTIVNPSSFLLLTVLMIWVIAKLIGSLKPKNNENK